MTFLQQMQSNGRKGPVRRPHSAFTDTQASNLA